MSGTSGSGGRSRRVVDFPDAWAPDVVRWCEDVEGHLGPGAKALRRRVLAMYPGPSEDMPRERALKKITDLASSAVEAQTRMGEYEEALRLFVTIWG